MYDGFVISQCVKSSFEEEIEKSAQTANYEFKAMSEEFVMSHSMTRRLTKQIEKSS